MTRLEVAHGAGGARVLEQHAEDAALGDSAGMPVARSATTTSTPVGSARVCDHRDGLRQGVGVDQEDAAP